MERKKENEKQLNIFNTNDDLIGKKVIWKGIEHTIIDKHNTSDYVLLDDKNMSIVGLHWKNVILVN